MISDALYNALRDGKLLIFAGAGLSSVAPSSLPGWNMLSEYMAKALLKAVALKNRALDVAPEFDHEDWQRIEMICRNPKLVPAYRAQVLHEFSGLSYFEGLSCVNVSKFNRAHLAIAVLAKHEHLSGVATTNFDRLIETASDTIGGTFDIAIDESSFHRFARTRAVNCATPALLKIHGCASAPASMVDTLKQRKLGRTDAFNQALDTFAGKHLLFVGFSGADLVHDPNYLQFRTIAAHASGATYLAWPSAPELSPGAKILLSHFGEKAEIVVDQIEDYFGALCSGVGLDGHLLAHPFSEAEETGADELMRSLDEWADRLSLPKAGLCLSAIFEASGYGERAARIPDRMIRKLLFDQTTSDPDWLAMAFHNGRLGAASGRFINVSNMSGGESDASAEVKQSLLRAAVLGKQPFYKTFIPLGFFWMGAVKTSLEWADSQTSYLAHYHMTVTPDGKKFVIRREPLDDLIQDGPVPMTSEQAVDAWMAIAQIQSIVKDRPNFNLVEAMADPIIQMAIESGDPVRGARAAAFKFLLAARSSAPFDVDRYSALFAEASQTGETQHEAVWALAHGRYLAGPAGRKLIVDELSRTAVAETAFTQLQKAIQLLDACALSGLAIYARIQLLKILADLNRHDEGQEMLGNLLTEAMRVQVLMPELQNAIGQIKKANGEVSARIYFEDAAYNAELLEFPEGELGLFRSYLKT